MTFDPPDSKDCHNVVEIIDTSTRLQVYDVVIRSIMFGAFTALEFLGYWGFLRVAHSYSNPHGLDEDAFEFVMFMNRNLRMAAVMGMGVSLWCRYCFFAIVV